MRISRSLTDAERDTAIASLHANIAWWEVEAERQGAEKGWAHARSKVGRYELALASFLAEEQRIWVWTAAERAHLYPEPLWRHGA